MIMGFTSQLGDSSSLIDSIPGVTDVTGYLQTKVQDTVQPYVIASLALGLIGVTFGLAAFIGMRSMKRVAAR